jgi:hypothetical protein
MVNKWLLLLYGLPAKNGAVRVSLWRQLKRSGALALKTSAYLLPDVPEHAERFQWMAQQVRDGGGEASLIRATEVEGLANEQIVRLFNEARAEDYEEFIAELKPVGKARHGTKSNGDLERLRARLQEIRQVDFFNCPRAQDAEMALRKAAGVQPEGRKAAKVLRSRFQGKAWLTRPRPEIDRVGSAWLIRRFIDPKARFIFSSDPKRHPDAIPYDMVDMDFSHHGDDCTFETLLKRFGIEDKALQKIAEMVHEADLEDGKYQRIECVGIDRVLKGWAKQGLSDEGLIQKGGECFDALYEYLRR